MFLSIALAFTLFAAPPAAAQKAAAPAKPDPADVSDIPHGAPIDDYGFTAWCRGALSGHMELYPSVKPELQKIEEEKADKEDARYTTDAQREAAVKRRTKEALEDTKLDEEQLAAGRMYLKLYTDAIVAAEGASASNLRAKGEEAQDAGYRIWAAARGAEPRTKMWSWVMWELPARCETAARRLLDRSSLLTGALKPQALREPTTQARADPAAAADAPRTDDAPKVDDALKLDDTPKLDAARKLDDALKVDDAPKVDDAKAADAKPEDAKLEPAKPEEDVVKLKGAEPASPEAETPAEAAEAKRIEAKPVGSRPVEATPVDAPKASEPAPADDTPAAKIAPASEGPVSRRASTAPPADAPDASPSAPKP